MYVIGTGNGVSGPGLVNTSNVAYKMFVHALNESEIQLRGTFTLNVDSLGLSQFTIPVPIDSVTYHPSGQLTVTGSFNDMNGNMGKVEWASPGLLVFSWYNEDDDYQEFDFNIVYQRSPIPCP